MNYFAVCVLLSALVVGVLSAPKSVRSCHSEGLTIPVGHTVPAPIGKCYHLKCEDAQTNAISSLTCAAFIPAPGHHIGKPDLTKPYPKCCPKSIRG